MAPHCPPRPPRIPRTSGEQPSLPRLVRRRRARRPPARVLDRRVRSRCRRRSCRRTSTGRPRARSPRTSRRHYPDRSPGGAGSIAAAAWFRDQMRQYDLPVSSSTWTVTIPGRGRTRLQNLWAVARGSSRQAIVVMAHRDDPGDGTGANDNATGTAALVELARGYALSTTPGSRVRSGHTIVFLSTDAGAFGGLGALRFASHPPFPVVAAIDLDAIGGTGTPQLQIAGDAPRSPAASLVQTASRRIEEQAGATARPPERRRAADRSRLPVHAVRPGAVRRARHPRADDLDGRRATAGVVHGPEQHALDGAHRSDRPCSAAARRLARPGARAGAGNDDVRLGGAAVRPRVGDRGGAASRCSSRTSSPSSICSRTAGAGASHSCRRFAACAAGSWCGCSRARRSTPSRALGAWPTGEPRPPSPASRAAGDWPVLALFLLAAISFVGWLFARPRLVPRRRVAPEEQLAGETAALIGLGIVALLVLATNPYALVFFVPALHAWLWLPHVRLGRRPLGALLLVAGLAGPALIVLSLAFRFGLGFDAPWYLLELVVARVRPRARCRDHARVRSMRRTTLRRDGTSLRAVPRARRATATRAVPKSRSRSRAHGACAPSVVRRAGRIVGVLLIVAGVLTLTWVVVVWQWQDPFTALYTHIQQNRLSHSYERRVHAYHPKPTKGKDLAAVEVQLAAEARAYQRTLHTGDPIGRLQIGRIDLQVQDQKIVRSNFALSIRRSPRDICASRAASAGSGSTRRNKAPCGAGAPARGFEVKAQTSRARAPAPHGGI